MRKKGQIKGIALAVVFVLALGLLAGCGTNKAKRTSDENGNAEDTKNITVGVCAGPYGDMTKTAIAPYLEKLGYQVTLKEFTDYVQPDKALDNGEIDANLMQHTAYLEKFAADNGLKISPVIIVPTAGMGIFSEKYSSLEKLPDGAMVGISNDPSNLARSLKLLHKLGVIQLKAEVDETKATINDIAENPKNIKFQEIDAAMISRNLNSLDAGCIPGNYAIAAGLDYKDALAIEKQDDNYKNIVAVRTEDLDGQLGKDLKAAVESEAFHKAIEDPNGIFKGFDKPAWYIEKYGQQ